MYETKRERLNAVQQAKALMTMSHGDSLEPDPEVSKILEDWVENGGDFDLVIAKIDEFVKKKYGITDEEEEL